MIEGSRSGSGSIPYLCLTDGSGSGSRRLNTCGYGGSGSATLTGTGNNALISGTYLHWQCCGSRILILPIPDSVSRTPDPKNSNNERNPGSEVRVPEKDPGSRGPKRHRILDPDPQHCPLVLVHAYMYMVHTVMIICKIPVIVRHE